VVVQIATVALQKGLTPLVVVVLVVAGCGEDRFAAERERAERLLPGIDELRCSGEPGRAVDCKGSLKGREAFCEFRYEGDGARATSETHACWSEGH
jgi:hypothetical protein